MSRRLGRVTGETGAVTVEAAIAIASIVVVVMLCVGAVLAVSAQVRCVDAARESARLVARGDREEAVPAGRRVAPRGARVEVREEGGYVTARVSTEVALLPLLRVSAEAVAAVEELPEVEAREPQADRDGGGR
ncbi:pilus assembly protein [Rhodococcus spelaei]|uniref:Pilus assembly protein n=1 Tax=Rhodococcus spelaei TaxID=2546320 RepID=A0A541BRL6_9NOCA|nr:TadE family protein [Rhodococcus spelaei]TQF74982.1 pilus assembly protein [Rhodococcus spelaei]